MISSAYRFIYLHPPKTGGSSIEVILEEHSNDRRYVNPRQTNPEVFSIRGMSPRKHAGLQEYSDLLGDEIKRYKTCISVRHPFDRVVSLYFSPHAWRRRNWRGRIVGRKPKWDPDRFLQLVARTRSAVEMLTVNGNACTPDYNLRFENLRADFVEFVSATRVPVDVQRLPHINKTAGTPDAIRRVLNDSSLRKIAEQRFSDDMAYFGY